MSKAAAAKAAPTPPTPDFIGSGPRHLPPVAQNCFALKEHQNPGFWICLPVEYTVDDLTDPGMWANIAGTGKLRSFSTVEVWWADMSQFAEFVVKGCGRNWADVELIRHVRLGQTRRPAAQHSFKVGFNGPVDQWRIVNTANNTTLKAGFATELAAQAFLAEHMKKIT